MERDWSGMATRGAVFLFALQALWVLVVLTNLAGEGAAQLAQTWWVQGVVFLASLAFYYAPFLVLVAVALPFIRLRSFDVRAAHRRFRADGLVWASLVVMLVGVVGILWLENTSAPRSQAEVNTFLRSAAALAGLRIVGLAGIGAAWMARFDMDAKAPWKTYAWFGAITVLLHVLIRIALRFTWLEQPEGSLTSMQETVIRFMSADFTAVGLALIGISYAGFVVTEWWRQTATDADSSGTATG